MDEENVVVETQEPEEVQETAEPETEEPKEQDTPEAEDEGEEEFSEEEQQEEAIDYQSLYEGERRGNQSLIDALHESGMAGSAAEIADQITANASGTSIDEVRKQRVERQRIYAQDILDIKAKYADEPAQSVDDLGIAFMKMRAAGIDAVKAYEVMNMDKIVAQKTKAAVAADRKKRESKKHLAGGGVTGASGAADVPRDVYNEYRKFFPSMSDKEIRRHYNAAKDD